MLLKCPECGLQVSDKALTCPHCGYPLNGEKIKTVVKCTRKHKRLPNGFGSITCISNQNLRNPYRARICVGKTDAGKPILKLLKPKAYFKTYNEAYEALVEYHKNPYDLEMSGMTLEELYEKWSADYFKELNPSSIRTIKAAWSYCKPLYKIEVKMFKPIAFKTFLENPTRENFKGEIIQASPYMKGRIKSLFNLMLDYAVEYEITDRNVARAFNLSKDVIIEMKRETRSHIAFTKDEMRLLWKNINLPYVDLILIQCYSGWRPQKWVNCY